MQRASFKTDVDKNLVALGGAIRLRRKQLELSQEALSALAEIDRSHMGKIERGELNVTMLNYLRIADALQLRSSELLPMADL